MVLFLATASISGYQSVELWSGMKEAEAAEEKAHTGAERAKTQLSKLQRQIGDIPEAVPPALLDSLASFSTKARHAAITHGLTLATVSGGQDILEMADKLPGTTLRSARLAYRGSYVSHAALYSWIEGLRREGAAIVAVRVFGKEFEVAVRIYGSEPANG